MAGVSDVLAGRYRLVRAIGEGPHGEVFEAEQIGLDRNVAVKIPNDDTDFSRIEREARASMRIASAVRVLECVRDHDPPFVVSELARGRSLATMIGAVTPDRVPRIARSLLAALETAHAAGVVHGDLRPPNIFVDGEDRVQLSDFGFDADEADTRKTSTLLIRSTMGYRAPERIRGRKADVSSDVFAAGVCLYELVSGHTPFGDDMRRVIEETPKPLASPLWAAIEKALAKKPEARFASARDMAHALERRRAIWPFVVAPIAIGLLGVALVMKRPASEAPVPTAPSAASIDVPSAPPPSEPASAVALAPPSSTPSAVATVDPENAVSFDFSLMPKAFTPDEQVGIRTGARWFIVCRRERPTLRGRFVLEAIPDSRRPNVVFSASSTTDLHSYNCLGNAAHNISVAPHPNESRRFEVVIR